MLRLGQGKEQFELEIIEHIVYILFFFLFFFLLSLVCFHITGRKKKEKMSLFVRHFILDVQPRAPPQGESASHRD